MSKLYIDIGKELLSVKLTDSNENTIKTVIKKIPTENKGSISVQDACDWWVLCAGAVRDIAESGIIQPGEIKEIVLTGNKDGAVMLDGDFLPASAAVVQMNKSVIIPSSCRFMLSPVSYLRYMLTGSITAQDDEYIIKNSADFPDISTGRSCDLSFEYFELSKEAAFLMKLKRPVSVKGR